MTFNRIRAGEFKFKNRYEFSYENVTMFTQLFNGMKSRMYALKIKHLRPFVSRFTGEGASDCGGPMRDVVSNVCNDLMSSVLPLLIPTANFLKKVEPCPDCYKLNPNATESFILRKYLFLGYFLGWSLRNMGALGIDIVPSFWKRLLGGPTYVYTLEDLHSMDFYRHRELTQV